MTSLLAILLLTIIQFLAGFGILGLLNHRLNTAMTISASVILGLGISSLLPFFLQLMYIPLTALNIFSTLFLVTLLLNARLKQQYANIQSLFSLSHFRIRLYEVPALLVISLIVFVSAWRCYYYPPTPRDLTSGPEVIADYTVKEKTMLNSVFSVDMQSTNNQFKPPFITTLQVVYKYAGFPFGQVWLTILFIFFIIFLYHALSIHLHRLITGLLIIAFLAIPEMYPYTFMVLFDYPNAVFFFLSVFFLTLYLKNNKDNLIILSGIFMGIACYIRSETLVLCLMLLPLLWWHHIKNWNSGTKLLTGSIYFLVPALLLYLVSVTIYINAYLPVKYDIGGQVNHHLWQLQPLFSRFLNINTKYVFSENGVNYYGYFFLIFIIIILFELSLTDHMSIDSRNWLYAILVIYLGYPILGYLLPLLDLDNSTKRGLFKIFPLMLLYFSHSKVLIGLSRIITNWEQR
jgi:hypothetical protein